MLSQLATFLAWEKDDAVLHLNTSHEAEVTSLVMQQEQRLASVQAQVVQQNVDALNTIGESNKAAAQALVAQNAEVSQTLEELHVIELATLQITLGSSRAAEIDSLSSEHRAHLTALAAQREQDRAESLSHITQALEQLTQEHAQSLAAAESSWAESNAQKQQLHQQQLQDLGMEHESTLTTLSNHWQERLQASQAQHDASLLRMSSEHESELSHLRQDAEVAQQLHAVQLVNLQLELEQMQRKAKAGLESAQLERAAALERHIDMQKRLQVSLVTCRQALY